jgi:MOSC domain-containing protein YiiM
LTRLVDAPVRDGRVVWIGLRPVRRQPLTSVNCVTAIAGQGLLGDHYDTRTNGARQVTLIAQEDLQAIASFTGREAIDPMLLRRNLVVAGMNLIALKDKRFRVGEAELEYSGVCEACSRMEESLGTGGFNAVRGHGGITARIMGAGEICIGHAVQIVQA